MKHTSLEHLLQHEIQDLFSAENQVLKVLPQMSKAATHVELKSALREHLQETKMHALRLHKIASKMDQSLDHHHCRGMEILIDETTALFGNDIDENVLDAALISVAQRIEHYEIAAYGSAWTLASRLGHHETAALLRETLDEEKRTDARLTEIAEAAVNEDAAVSSQTT